eukprot:730858_1
MSHDCVDVKRKSSIMAITCHDGIIAYPVSAYSYTGWLENADTAGSSNQQSHDGMTRRLYTNYADNVCGHTGGPHALRVRMPVTMSATRCRSTRDMRFHTPSSVSILPVGTAPTTS